MSVIFILKLVQLNGICIVKSLKIRKLPTWILKSSLFQTFRICSVKVANYLREGATSTTIWCKNSFFQEGKFLFSYFTRFRPLVDSTSGSPSNNQACKLTGTYSMVYSFTRPYDVANFPRNFQQNLSNNQQSEKIALRKVSKYSDWIRTFGLNAGKYRAKKNSVFRHFSRSVNVCYPKEVSNMLQP